MKPTMVVDSAGVAAAMADARLAGRVAVDAEFLWERTYAPIPCLIQIASEERIWLIDPIAGAPLDGVAELMADSEVTKVMHAPGSDLTLFAAHFDTTPSAIWDTQLTAGFVGLGSGASLLTLLDWVLSVRLAKAESYSDWSKRPLSEAQIEYGADDVRYLLALADEIARRAAALGREAWLGEELERRFGPGNRFITDPEEAWKRVKGGGRSSNAERSVLQSVAAWRERTARQRDRPLQWLLPDRTLLEIAKRRPESRARLGQVRGLPDQMSTADRDALVAAVADGITRPPPPQPPGIPNELRERLEMLGSLGNALVVARAGAAEVAPGLVASRDEVGRYLYGILSNDEPSGELAVGWRWDVAGEALSRLARSEIGLTPTSEPPYVREVPLGELASG